MTTSFRIRVAILALAFATAACANPSGSPAGAVQGFMRAMSQGYSDMALRYVCKAGITVLPNLTFNWQEDRYEVVSTEIDTALIRMTGESLISQRDWSRWGNQLGLPLPPLASIRIHVEYDWTVSKQGESWCVPEASLSQFIEYILGLVKMEIP